MNVIDYLKVLKRRWTVIALATAVALGVGLLTTFAALTPSENTAAATTSFTAEAIVWDSHGGQNSGLSNLDTLAAFVTIGEVPVRAAKEIGKSKTPEQLAASIEATADPATQLLTISAVGASADEARQLASVFAGELIKFVGREQNKLASAQRQGIEDTIEGIEQEIAALDEQIQNATGDEATDLRSSREAKVNQLEQQELTLGQVGSTITESVELELVSLASAQPATGPGTFQPPRSRVARLLISGILGLLAGIALALVLERFDTRIYGKSVAEESFGLPVIAEIPEVPSRQMKKAPLVTVAAPALASSSAYRLLAAELGSRMSSYETFQEPESVELATHERFKAAGSQSSLPVRFPGGQGHASRADELGDERSGDLHVLLVTSSAPDEGKTSLVANLAASLSEQGKRVLVLSCDFQHPDIHRLLGVPESPGLAESLADGSGASILNGQVKRASNLGGRLVEVVPSGKPGENASELLSSPTLARVIEEAKSRADIVLLDTPPLLTSSDAVLLFPHVDSVLVVARAGKTTANMAMRTSELLLRLDAPAAGIVMNGTTGGNFPRRSRREG
ncbi:MAG: AAA family ATPase [Actinomycetota bacterium]